MDDGFPARRFHMYEEDMHNMLDERFTFSAVLFIYRLFVICLSEIQQHWIVYVIDFSFSLLLLHSPQKWACLFWHLFFSATVMRLLSVLKPNILCGPKIIIFYAKTNDRGNTKYSFHYTYQSK